MTKVVRLLIPIGIVATIIGYMSLIYKAYSLDADISKKQAKVTNLNTIIAKLKQDSIALAKNNFHLDKSIRETDSTIALASLKSKTVEDLRINLGIPKDTYFTETPKNDINLENAGKYETEGFRYLLDKKIDDAIKSFIKSENSYNSYHSVYDLSKYLTKKKGEMTSGNPDFWNSIYKEILTNYSWGMSKEMKAEFQHRILS